MREKATSRRRIRAGLLGAAASAIAIFAAPSASAQGKTFYLDRLFMAGAPEDTIALWRPQMAPKTRFYGQLGLGFAFEPFRTENEIQDKKKRSEVASKDGQPVLLQLNAYANVGVELLDRLAFQVQFPATVFMMGADSNQAGVANTANLKPGAPMDLRLDVRGILYRNDSRSFKLGAEAAVWIPTGNPETFASDGGASGQLAFAAEVNLKSVFFLFNAGFHFRPLGAFNDFTVSHEFRYGLGVYFPIRDGMFRIGGQLFGSMGITKETAPGAQFFVPNLPLEWMLDTRFALDQKKRGWIGAGGGTRLTPGYAPDFRVVFVAGYSFGIADTDPPSPGKRFKQDRYADHGADTDKDGIPDDIDLCPNEPEDHKPPNPDDGCPALPDRDGDGIPDVDDKCPDQPEDFDGIDDTDGCPEDDADKDGIADAQDACPKEPGPPDADAKKNGCPQFIRRVTGSTEIQILKTIEFQTGRATILSKSFPILDEVVRLLKVNPDITKLAIEGHTDNRGSDELNEKLSNDRAHSVMKYIVEHGIAADRLTAAGFGPKRPIADNNTNDGRQRNRRVEFHIVNQIGGDAKPPPPPGEVPPQ